MADGGDEADKSEEATPFKLAKAREKGSVARGIDLSFFAGAAALAGFLGIAGPALAQRLAQAMREALIGGMSHAADPIGAATLAGATMRPLVQPVAVLGGTIVAVVLLLEIVQLRGLSFSAHPLKPDFTRINPAKGLKRLFSLRMLKEAAKSLVKLVVYAAVAWLVVRGAVRAAYAVDDAGSLASALHAASMRLLWWFVGLALAIAALDQLIARKAFAKQMRMSRREVTREAKEREGEPRLKRKRKQLHAEFAKNSAGLGALPGSDMLIVNPEHVAVALGYDRAAAAAPIVRAKARDLHAQTLKRQARRLGVPVIENPPLARALWADSEQGEPIGPQHYHAVAELYFRLDAGCAEDAS